MTNPLEIIKIEEKPDYLKPNFKREKYDFKWLDIVKKYQADKDGVIRCFECKSDLRILDNQSNFWLGGKNNTNERKWFCERCSLWAMGLDGRGKTKPAKYQNWLFDEEKLTEVFMLTHFPEDMKALYPVKEMSFTEKYHWLLKGDYGLLETLTDTELNEIEQRLIHDEPKIITMPDSALVNKAYLRALNNLRYVRLKRSKEVKA